MNYQCPLCHQPLALKEKMFKCEKNHQFDLAKEGYVNLMPAHHKRSKDPGDNQDMMQARRRFLEGNYYDPMRQEIAQLCANYTQGTAHQVLDIGCGEGYYTDQIQKVMQKQSDNAAVYGLDISKVAIRYAAKRYTHCHFSVASSHRLPFADESLDAIVRIYAPCKAAELQRVVRENGVILTVTPAGRHLYQLRERIYQDVRLHSEEPESIEGYRLEHQKKLNYVMDLKDGAAFDLLQMTPFAWKATDELREELKSTTLFQCEADFMLHVYRKKSL
ncbi:23S rRNA m(1)G-745 methyltransferase (EC 21151) [Vibrio sp. ES.051]|uniref:23S rRNA (guanine(745)-N(1))-methyltransferase n=1 Tax=Vibrio sp. ES.051 TaxID=1761909 RepID=UPI000BF661CA|nr:23S rRNA (guanine(745)-N(1))-methyltransferase [Vibrio sp. ES.051]PFG55684.1 23S rRNA m(1)G-745 methyltransferase (EC 21151) [Vibrio sp. ES.051]